MCVHIYPGDEDMQYRIVISVCFNGVLITIVEAYIILSHRVHLYR